MKSQTTYSFDSSDGGALSLDRLERVHNALQGFLAPAETDDRNPHPGVKGLRRIRGNVFARGDIEAFSALVGILAERAEARVAELHAERDEIAADERSQAAYDGLIEMLESARKSAVRDMASFMEAFEEEAAAPSLACP